MWDMNQVYLLYHQSHYQMWTDHHTRKHQDIHHHPCIDCMSLLQTGSYQDDPRFRHCLHHTMVQNQQDSHQGYFHNLDHSPQGD